MCWPGAICSHLWVETFLPENATLNDHINGKTPPVQQKKSSQPSTAVQLVRPPKKFEESWREALNNAVRKAGHNVFTYAHRTPTVMAETAIAENCNRDEGAAIPLQVAYWQLQAQKKSVPAVLDHLARSSCWSVRPD